MQRDEAKAVLAENPSLKPQIGQIMLDAYRRARRDAARETVLPADTFPVSCPWPFDQAVADDFWPD